MRTTIDTAGRQVIPAPLREKLGLRPGTELEVIEDHLSIRLVPRVPPPRLVRVGKLLIARPTAKQGSLPEGLREELLRTVAGDGVRGGRVSATRIVLIFGGAGMDPDEARRGIADSARAASATLVVTTNRRHFAGLLPHGVRVLSSDEFVTEAGV